MLFCLTRSAINMLSLRPPEIMIDCYWTFDLYRIEQSKLIFLFVLVPYSWVWSIYILWSVAYLLKY